ncbi:MULTISPECIES: phosphatidylglycerophosphatase A [unclassified Acinetobacter]|uniref:phosphatidylglycerophosphatase A family protein n=1 Tax=unclassified Acinetobacter TaxID=196816 RepID=UPI0029342593|nr:MULTISPECIES: phosphatidylglycerophosphatase A [unclassified Acinetobacter]WOE33166.1 phosphatidylglycerophosphatase A [Acinetobacter sp. SAAs470]WOE39112.1 phosphatidylglycerophosphatase A [Acinetobacter sp. SAAs474]
MSWFNRFIVFCGVGFGSGLAPKAPGTFGSAFALLFVPIWLAFGFYYTLIAIVIMSIIGIYICGQTAKIMGVHDDGRIVWDEFAGQSITFLPLIYIGQMSWLWVLVSFALFRLFDVWKPWPIRVIDRQVAGGFGIMFDDIIAGIWAAICIIIYLNISMA